MGITKRPSLPFEFPELAAGYKEKARYQGKATVNDPSDLSGEESGVDSLTDNEDEETGATDEDELHAIAQSDFDELRDSAVLPAGTQQARDLFYIARLSALMEDLDIAEKAEEEEQAKDLEPAPQASHLRPHLGNILNPDPVPSRIEEVYKLQPILRQSDMSVDVSAVVSLRKAHDRNSGVLSEKSFELKTRYAEYEPPRLAEASSALYEAADMPESSGSKADAVSQGLCHICSCFFTHPASVSGPLTPNEIRHRLRLQTSTDDSLQAQMNKRRGGYSRNERWTTNNALQTGSNTAVASTSMSEQSLESPATLESARVKAGTWALAKALATVVPKVNDQRVCLFAFAYAPH